MQSVNLCWCKDDSVVISGNADGSCLLWLELCGELLGLLESCLFLLRALENHLGWLMLVAELQETPPSLVALTLNRDAWKI